MALFVVVILFSMRHCMANGMEYKHPPSLVGDGGCLYVFVKFTVYLMLSNMAFTISSSFQLKVERSMRPIHHRPAVLFWRNFCAM